MANGLAKREKFHVPALGNIETIIGPIDPILGMASSRVGAQLRCIACDAFLEWREGWKLFACPECGFELTASEAIELCDSHVRELRKLAELAGKKRGWLWRLAQWFAG